MKLTKEIPEFLKHLPVDERGYPIPYFAPIVDGKPNFKYADYAKLEICVKYDKCWICGKKLIKGIYFFISGIRGLTNQVASDGAMHRECAEYSMRICPHLYYEKSERKIEVSVAANSPLIVKDKPSVLYLIKCRDWRMVHVPNGRIDNKTGKEELSPIIQFKAVSHEIFIYENNVLRKAQF